MPEDPNRWNLRTLEKRIIGSGLFKCIEDEGGRLKQPVGLRKFANNQKCDLHPTASWESDQTLSFVRELAGIVLRGKRPAKEFLKRDFLEGLSETEFVEETKARFRNKLDGFLVSEGYPVAAASKKIDRLCNAPEFKKSIKARIGKSDAFVTKKKGEMVRLFYDLYGRLYLAFAKYLQGAGSGKSPSRQDITYYMAHLLCRIDKGPVALPGDVRRRYNAINRFVDRLRKEGKMPREFPPPGLEEKTPELPPPQMDRN